MPLTEVAVRNTKPEAKPVKLSDGQGMYLLIQPTGSKLWRLKYRFGGREKVLAIGQYPQITLKEARAARDDARKLLANDVDPGEHRKAVKQAGHDRAGNSFEVIAREWLTKYAPTWSPSHVETMSKRLERDIFPWLGSKPIADIKAPDLLIQLRRIEGRGALETAHRVLGTCGQIFRYAVATGRAERDPSGDLRGALPPAKEKHHAAVIDGSLEPKERERRVGELLRTLHDYQGGFIVASALRLAPLVFVRPGELRTMRWQDVDLDKAEWVYRVGKTDTDHVVPLSNQAITILKDMHALSSASEYVFPSARTRTRPMSDNAILGAMRRMNIPKDEMTGHGFRAIARTLLDEVLGFRVDLIEHQLAHAVKDANGRAYNRTAHLPERRKMMQSWADYLDNLKSDTREKVTPIKRKPKTEKAA
ncbi:MAG: integrase [Gammaproteobacteria bacterium 28-57-27]|nr:MAG: integrase [Gammaproteobacteria bacterium 28-57-27]